MDSCVVATVDLVEDKEARARQRMEKARSEDKGVMATIIDELLMIQNKTLTRPQYLQGM